MHRTFKNKGIQVDISYYVIRHIQLLTTTAVLLYSCNVYHQVNFTYNFKRQKVNDKFETVKQNAFRNTHSYANKNNNW